MKTGSLYIDGSDAWLTYGAFVVEGGWTSLVCMPPLKAVESNDWQEEDGIEVDLSAPVLDTREVEIPFAFCGLYARPFALLDVLADGAYHTFRCAEIGRTFRLRLVSQPSHAGVRNLELVKLKFADDFPLDGYTYADPQTSIVQAYDYLVDDAPLSRYGVRVLRGTMANIRKCADVKEALLRNIGTQSGTTYDGGAAVHFASKEVKVLCLLRAASLDELWRNYDALLYDLTQPDERTLYVSEMEETFHFYYKSCSVTAFYPCDAQKWLEFTLTLVFTNEVRSTDDDTLLATEDGTLAWTEDSDSAVEMLPDRFGWPTLRMAASSAMRLTGARTFRFNN